MHMLTVIFKLPLTYKGIVLLMLPLHKQNTFHVCISKHFGLMYMLAVMALICVNSLWLGDMLDMYSL